MRFSGLLFLAVISMAVLFSADSAAAGPLRVASSNRALWPYAIDSAASFDLASRAEILALAKAWKESIADRDIETFASWLSLKKANTGSIERWKMQVGDILSDNFERASSSCLTKNGYFCPKTKTQNWEQIQVYAQSQWDSLPTTLHPWGLAQVKFYETYLYELLRLAALFPDITSEILPLNNQEIIGGNYSDKSFLLTFDDGPTPANGETDKLVTSLRRNNVNATFFLLGERIRSRLEKTSVRSLKDLYDGMCIASHGAVHQSHPQMQDWRESIDTTNSLLTTVLPAGQKSVSYFRPPYGQRSDEIGHYISGKQQKIMLWNIDSQDWNSRIGADEVTGRLVSLMLLWRRGILLFHDTHPKVARSLPALLDFTNKSGVHWVDCRELEK